MKVTIPEFTVSIPTPLSIIRQWKWVLMGMLVLAYGLVITRDAPTATAAESITSPDVGDIAGTDTSLVLDANGNPVVSYASSDGLTLDLNVMHCNDANCAGGAESTIPVDTTGSVGEWTSLTLDASGNPVVSYFDGTGENLKLLHCNDANCAPGSDSITSPDTGGVVGQYTSLVLDTSGSPVVSYYDQTNSDLKVLHCNDANCAPGGDSITSPDTGGGVGFFTSLELDTVGHPVVSYYDNTNSDLKVLHCNDANCAPGGDSVTSPDSGGLTGFYSSLELDATGNPVVSYASSDGLTLDLNVLHCNDANCGPGGDSTVPVDTAGDVGYFLSLGLEGAGFPVVSYRDNTNGDLKVLHCNDANCAPGGDSTMSVDTADDVGSDTSLALDVAGNPVVSYFDATNDDLKVLHCNDADCSGTEKQLPINITNIGQYALPKSCFKVLDPGQVPYFEVCDNDFAGAPESDPICGPDAICGDDDPAPGSIVVSVDPGDYRVVVGQAAPEHTAVTPKSSCTYPTPVGGDTCELTFINTPKVRPWHPWDLTGGPGGAPDGVVRVADILAVIQHYFDDKPLSP
jgi:hypothetical protein